MKYSIKTLALLFVMAVLCASLPAMSFPIAAEESASVTEYNHQTTVPDGYIGIYTKADLDAVRNNTSGKYIMMNDIVFSESDFAAGGAFYNEGMGWQPFPRFSGVFDGNGYAIKNLMMLSEGDILESKDTNASAGLFASNSGCIKNLGVVDGEFFSIRENIQANLGSIVGLNEASGSVVNCYSTSELVVMSDLIAQGGGIVGWNRGNIYESYFYGDVVAYSVGDNSSITQARAGGIAAQNGMMQQNTGITTSEIVNCFNAGSVNAMTFYTDDDGSVVDALSAGIVARNYAIVTTCYNVGGVFASSSTGADCIYTGGIVAWTNADTKDAYFPEYIDQLSRYGQYRKLGTECTVEELQKAETFSGFNFNTVWTMEGETGYAYPELRKTPMHIGNELVAVDISKMPTKTEYVEGVAELDLTGGALTLIYADGTTGDVNMQEELVPEFEAAAAGDTQVLILYDNFMLTLPVTILPKEVTKITVETLPTITTFFVGSGLNINGGQIRVYYNNDTQEVISFAPEMVLGFDPYAVGKQNLTIHYQGAETTYTVTVKEKEAVSIQLLGLPDKTTYRVGEALDTTGLLVNVAFDDGTYEWVDDYAVSGYSSTPGEKTIKVSYGGQTATFTVTVKGGGDTNGDGKVTVTDMLAVKAHLLGKSKLTGDAATAGDANGDGKITITDFIQIKSHILGKSTLK